MIVIGNFVEFIQGDVLKYLNNLRVQGRYLLDLKGSGGRVLIGDA